MIIFFADITGIGDVKAQMYRRIFGDDIKLISPYKGLTKQVLSQPFGDDYQRFCTLVGMDNYVQLVKAELKKIAGKPFIAVGESVGASALWRCSELPLMEHCKQLTCLYGSRIRDHLDVKPICPIKLLFSCDEQYFLSQSTINSLMQNPKVEVEISKLKHGFASPTHSAFEQPAFEQLMTNLQSISLSTFCDRNSHS